jgi:hypothetical protein
MRGRVRMGGRQKYSSNSTIPIIFQQDKELLQLYKIII